LMREFTGLIEKHDIPDEAHSDFRDLAEARLVHAQTAGRALTGGTT
jgi:hypothetical protein